MPARIFRRVRGRARRLAVEAGGGDDAAVGGDGHAVDPAACAEIMDDAWRWPTLPSGPRSAAIRTRRVGAIVRDVQRLLVGREGQSVGFDGRGQERDDVAFAPDQENAFEIELAGLVADVTRVGDINAPSRSTATSLGLLNRLFVVAVGERADRAVAVGDRNATAAAGVGPLGDDQPARLSKIIPLARPLGSRKTVVLPVLRVKPHDPVADVGKEDRAVLVERPPFGERALAPDLFQRRPGCDNFLGTQILLRKTDPSDTSQIEIDMDMCICQTPYRAYPPPLYRTR